MLDDGAAIPAHALLETYSVLTGFPPPHRAPLGLVSEWIEDRFTVILEPPTASRHLELVSDLANAGHIGGWVHDALVSVTAKLHDATLVSADIRATRIYQLVGVDHHQL